MGTLLFILFVLWLIARARRRARLRASAKAAAASSATAHNATTIIVNVPATPPQASLPVAASIPQVAALPEGLLQAPDGSWSYTPPALRDGATVRGGGEGEGR